MSDYLNPPYRLLPVPMHHGAVLSSFYRLSGIFHDPEFIKAMERYDPSFTLEDQSEAEHMIRMFEEKRPRLILLCGNFGRLFATSDLFFQWVTDHYQVLLDDPNGSLFAVLRD